MPCELLTIRDYIRWGASRLNAHRVYFGHGTDNALDEATLLVLHVVQLDASLPESYGDCRLTADETRAIEDLIEQRIEQRMPAPYLIGEAWFAGLCFDVDPRVLIPRSPIAELIEHGFEMWIGDRQGGRVLDLCTGGGCIAVATAVHRPDLQVEATDLSCDALAVAQQNVDRHQVGDRVRLQESDLFDAIPARQYDLIISNPPYVGHQEIESLPPEYQHEPDSALRSGDDGLDIPLRILAQAPDHLNEEGTLIMEVGNSAEDLQRLLPESPFLWLEFERGGHGVLALSAQQLTAMNPQVHAVMKARH